MHLFRSALWHQIQFQLAGLDAIARREGRQADTTFRASRSRCKAFRDTWKDGIHSYLTYLRDRLTVARELLTESGSIFVQIGDENVHRVRAVMDEVFGAENFVAQISYSENDRRRRAELSSIDISIILFGIARDQSNLKFRQLYIAKTSRAMTVTLTYKFDMSDGILRSRRLREDDPTRSIARLERASYRLDNRQRTSSRRTRHSSRFSREGYFDPDKAVLEDKSRQAWIDCISANRLEPSGNQLRLCAIYSTIFQYFQSTIFGRTLDQAAFATRKSMSSRQRRRLSNAASS